MVILSSELNAVYGIDFKIFIQNIFIIIAFIVAGTALISKFCEIIGKPIKWLNKQNKDHDLLVQTIDKVDKMVKTHATDKKDVTKQNDDLRQMLTDFMTEVRDVINDTQSTIQQYGENRIHDREVSFEKEQRINDRFDIMITNNESRDNKIDALIVANKEMLAEKINEKYKYYVSINGIPEDEYDEFVSLHSAYKGVGGNHHGDAKYEYCINHLEVIPVEKKLVLKD